MVFLLRGEGRLIWRGDFGCEGLYVYCVWEGERWDVYGEGYWMVSFGVWERMCSVSCFGWVGWRFRLR